MEEKNSKSQFLLRIKNVYKNALLKVKRVLEYHASKCRVVKQVILEKTFPGSLSESVSKKILKNLVIKSGDSYKFLISTHDLSSEVHIKIKIFDQ